MNFRRTWASNERGEARPGAREDAGDIEALDADPVGVTSTGLTVGVTTESAACVTVTGRQRRRAGWRSHWISAGAETPSSRARLVIERPVERPARGMAWISARGSSGYRTRLGRDRGGAHEFGAYERERPSRRLPLLAQRCAHLTSGPMEDLGEDSRDAVGGCRGLPRPEP